MSEVGTAACWILAAVFAWAAQVKLRRTEATATSFEALGLPAPGLLAVAVPVAELLVAVVLVVVPAVGAAAAIALLAAFSTLLARQVRAGGAVACGCFGSASSQPVSIADLVRNAFLFVAAVVGLWADVGTPTLPAALLVGTGAVIALMLHGLARLKLELGVVWRNTLPGEPVAPGRASRRARA